MPQFPQSKVSTYAALVDPPERLLHAEALSKHYSERMEMERAVAKKKSESKYCGVCSSTTQRERQKKKTSYWCPQCKVPLWLGTCFQEYLTLKKY